MKITILRNGGEVKEVRTSIENKVEQPVILKIDKFEFHFKIIGKVIETWDREYDVADDTSLLKITPIRVHTDNIYPRFYNKAFNLLLKKLNFEEVIRENFGIDNGIFYFVNREKIKKVLKKAIKEVEKYEKEQMKENELKN